MIPVDPVGVGPAQAVSGGPAFGASVRRAPDRDRHSSTEVLVGGILLALTAMAGVYFAFRPASGTVDGWFLTVVAGSNSRVFTSVTSLRYPVVIVVGAGLVAALAVPCDRPRAVACLVGPPLALALCELVAKPLVGRTLGGVLSYPSGSTVGAAALATAVVLATPARWRPVAVVVAGGYAVWMAVGVVALRWHYPTDALAGLAFGAGVVLLVDGAAWKVAVRLRQGRPAVRRPPDVQGGG
ncbi:MAG: phosphatase PAP2 family protein [Acidimicrobiales bacterium]